MGCSPVEVVAEANGAWVRLVQEHDVGCWQWNTTQKNGQCVVWKVLQGTGRKGVGSCVYSLSQTPCKPARFWSQAKGNVYRSDQAERTWYGVYAHMGLQLAEFLPVAGKAATGGRQAEVSVAGASQCRVLGREAVAVAW